MGFTYLTIVEAIGYMGGVWLLWNKNSISLEVISAGDQALTIEVIEQRNKPWLAIVVYSSPKVTFREEL